jgi:hypothetical protein
MAYQDFTSLPPEQERAFIVYEQTSTEAGKKAMTLGAIVGGCIGLLAIILFMSFDAPKNPHAEEPAASELKEEKVAPAPAPAPAATEAPAAAEGDTAAAEGEGAAAGDTAAEGSAPTEAPAPPAGASKAPPTALVH